MFLFNGRASSDYATILKKLTEKFSQKATQKFFYILWLKWGKFYSRISREKKSWFIIILWKSVANSNHHSVYWISLLIFSFGGIIMKNFRNKCKNCSVVQLTDRDFERRELLRTIRKLEIIRCSILWKEKIILQFVTCASDHYTLVRKHLLVKEWWVYEMDSS